MHSVEPAPPDRSTRLLGSALASGLFAWGILWSLPAALRPVFGHAASTGIVFAALCVLLAITRSRIKDRGWRLVVALLAIGMLAGATTLSLWLYAIVAFGTSIGLSPISHIAPATSAANAWLQLVLLAPLFEEMLYRERVLTALRPRLGGSLSVLASSAMFALPHCSSWGILATLSVGIALGGVMLVARSTALCIGYHAGLNLAMILAASVSLWNSALLIPSAALGLVALLVGICIARATEIRPCRRRHVLCAVACVLLPQSGWADLLRWEGSLVFDPIEEALPLLELPGSGVAVVNGSGGGLALESLRLHGGISGSVIGLIIDTTLNAGALMAIQFDASLGSGTLRPFQPAVTPVSPQLTRGTLPVHGNLRLCFILTSCEGSSDIALTASTSDGGRFGMGLGGTAVGAPFAFNPVSLAGAPWTVRTTHIALPTPGGFTVQIASEGWIHGAWSFTGSTALTGGALQLVTPALITPLFGDSPATGFARLTIRFVPEAHSLLLLGSGAVGLALAAWRRGT